jgi:hypothetical protein
MHVCLGRLRSSWGLIRCSSVFECEHRTRLVGYVVTDKLDVREAALSLPDEEVAVTPEDVVDEA